MEKLIGTHSPDVILGDFNGGREAQVMRNTFENGKTPYGPFEKKPQEFLDWLVEAHTVLVEKGYDFVNNTGKTTPFGHNVSEKSRVIYAHSEYLSFYIRKCHIKQELFPRMDIYHHYESYAIRRPTLD